MIKQAYIFGELGKAAFLENRRWLMLDLRQPLQPSPWHPFDQNLLAIDTLSIQKLQNVPDLKSLQFALESETHRHEALNMALRLMDTSIGTPALKEKTALLLNSYLDIETTKVFIENRLFCTPVPEGFIPLFAADICNKLELKWLADTYTSLNKYAPLIEVWDLAWTIKAKDYFETQEKADIAYGFLIENGLNREILKAIMLGDSLLIDSVFTLATLALIKQQLITDIFFFAPIKTKLVQYLNENLTQSVPVYNYPNILNKITEIIELVNTSENDKDQFLVPKEQLLYNKERTYQFNPRIGDYSTPVLSMSNQEQILKEVLKYIQSNPKGRRVKGIKGSSILQTTQRDEHSRWRIVVDDKNKGFIPLMDIKKRVDFVAQVKKSRKKYLNTTESSKGKFSRK